MTHKLEDNYNCRDSPPGERGPGPVSGSLAWGSCTEKSPLKLWLWRPQASLLARGLWETETPPLKGAHKISYSGTQGQSSNLKRVWLFTMTYRKKNLYIIHKHKCIYTQGWNKCFVKQSVLPSYFLFYAIQSKPQCCLLSTTLISPPINESTWSLKTMCMIFKTFLHYLFLVA